MKKVLFVCEQNRCRSQMAKAFFNELTSSQSSDSAGTRPGDRVDPSAVQVMREVGINISGEKPKPLSNQMNNRYDIIVTMGCISGCPVTPLEKTLAWDIEDPAGGSLEQYRSVRDVIKEHVERLIKEIGQGKELHGSKRLHPKTDIRF
jgi:arsenate reductase